MEFLNYANQSLAVVISFLTLAVILVAVLLLLFRLIDLLHIRIIELKEQFKKLHKRIQWMKWCYYTKKQPCRKCKNFTKTSCLSGMCDYGCSRNLWDKCFASDRDLFKYNMKE